MNPPEVWVELCAGSAAVALQLVGGPKAMPPIGYMGSKRSFAPAILSALGLRPGLGARHVILNDLGPWGPVWSLLVQPGAPQDVADVISSWQHEAPRDLWNRLRAVGWGDLQTAEDVAVLIQTASMSVDTSDRWSGGFAATGRSTGVNRTRHVLAVAGYLMGSAWSYRMGDLSSGFVGERSLTGRVRSSTVIAGRVVGLELPARTTVFSMSAVDIVPPDDCTGVYVYIDPPYLGTSGYRHKLSRAEVLDLARRWDAAGATVCVSEAERLVELVGWPSLDITCHGSGRRTFSKQSREFITSNRKLHWAGQPRRSVLTTRKGGVI